MFEIGATLREARERRGVTYGEAEGATRIRARYLAALEEERFAELPGEAYARSFLREYGEFLGLDGQRLATEYDLRFAAPEAFHVEPASFPRRGWPWRRLLVAVLTLAVAGIIVAAVVVPGGSKRPSAQRAVAPHPTTRTQTPKPTPPRPHRRPALPHLKLVAARGDCWLEIHAGSSHGPLLHEGLLPRGSSLAFARRFLWIRIGAPSSLDVQLNGEPLLLPLTHAPLNVQFALGKLRVVA